MDDTTRSISVTELELLLRTKGYGYGLTPLDLHDVKASPRHSVTVTALAVLAGWAAIVLLVWGIVLATT